MAYTKRIVCLANSLKTGGLCIAGREVTDFSYGAWIRPVSVRPHEELTYLEYRYPDGSSARLLDILDVPLLRPSPDGHQRENHLIDPNGKWTKHGELPFDKLRQLAESPRSLWSNADHTASGLINCVSREEAALYGESLYLIEVAELAVCVTQGQHGNKSFYGVFTLNGMVYKLSVTDPAIRERLDSYRLGKYRLPEYRNAILCVSLTKPYEGDGRCHKLIAAVLTPPAP